MASIRNEGGKCGSINMSSCKLNEPLFDTKYRVVRQKWVHFSNFDPFLSQILPILSIAKDFRGFTSFFSQVANHDSQVSVRVQNVLLEQIFAPEQISLYHKSSLKRS